MMKQTPSPADIVAWNSLALDSAMLWMESAQVMWLRGLRIAAGGKLAEREAERMVREKLTANWELGWSLFMSPSPKPEATAQRSVKYYRGKVKANQRRLEKR